MIDPVEKISRLAEETEEVILAGGLSKERYDVLIERRNTLQEIIVLFREWMREDDDEE